MLIDGYGIRLERLKEKDIQLVREKRNALHVSRYMQYREHITPEMQRRWFKSINNINNLYYLIYSGHEKVGLIYGAEIDWQKKATGNGGIFIWDETWWSTEIPFKANLVMLDLSILFGLTASRIKVLRDNHRAILYNARLGYKMLPGQEAENNQAYELTMNDYLTHTKQLRNYLIKKHGTVFDVTIDDPEHPVTRFLVERYGQMPAGLRQKLNVIYP